MATPFARHALVWIDLELTGLDLRKDTIVEIAVIITDHRLKHQVEGPSLVIKTDPSTLSEWCQETFKDNGLLKDMQNSTLTTSEAEDRVLAFILQHVPDPNVGILAGSSVHVDRQWLLKYMPRITDHLHYRIVDVSGMNVLSKSWCPWIFKEREDADVIVEGASEFAGSGEEVTHGDTHEEQGSIETETQGKMGTKTEEKERDVVVIEPLQIEGDQTASKAVDSIEDLEPRQELHRALYDIRQSIEQLKFLKKYVFVQQPKPQPLRPQTHTTTATKKRLRTRKKSSRKRH